MDVLCLVSCIFYEKHLVGPGTDHFDDGNWMPESMVYWDFTEKESFMVWVGVLQ